MATRLDERRPPLARPPATETVPKAYSLVTVPADEIDGELELRDYLLVLRRRRMIVVLTMAVVVGVACVLSYIQTPVYAATAKLRIEPRAGVSVFDTTSGQASGSALFVPTEIEVLQGEPVQEIVRGKLNSAPPVSVRQVGTTAVVQIVAESTDARKAAAVANAYAEAYIEHRRQQGIDESIAAQDEVQTKIEDLQDQIADLDRQIGPDPGPGAASLQAQRESLVEQQSLFQDNLNRQQVNRGLITGGAEVVRSAAVPGSPIKPTPLRNAILALVVGGLLGVGLAFLAEYLDDSIPNQEALQQITGAVPVIGLIPEVPGWKTKEKSRLVAMESPRSGPAEAYRALRTAIDFIGLDHPMRTLQVTSPGQGEGKTTTLANLGITLATAGKRVVIVCCDLRRPRIHEFFGLDNKVGFTSTLLGERPVSAAMQNVPGVPRLRLLASGPLPPNPSELLSSRRTADVFAALAAEADIVLIDAPPVLPVTDALVLFRHVDATLMVFSADTTTRKEAAAAMAKVRQVEGPVIGAVLNGVKAEDGYGYGGYSYRYEPSAGSAQNGAAAPQAPSPDALRPAPRRAARPAARAKFARPPAEG
jgi:polysaccharide biosynthesis transport protein